nr:MAG TPA: putative tail component [Caudoviricetes sp.]
MLKKSDRDLLQQKIDENMKRFRALLPKRSGRLRRSLQIKVNSFGEISISFNKQICPYYLWVKNITKYIYQIEDLLSRLVNKVLGIIKEDNVKINIKDEEKYYNEKQFYYTEKEEL